MRFLHQWVAPSRLQYQTRQARYELANIRSKLFFGNNKVTQEEEMRSKLAKNQLCHIPVLLLRHPPEEKL